MRKIRIIEHISLDGVIQAPGGPEEDPGIAASYPIGHGRSCLIVAGVIMRRNTICP